MLSRRFGRGRRATGVLPQASLSWAGQELRLTVMATCYDNPTGGLSPTRRSRTESQAMRGFLCLQRPASERNN